MNVEPKQFQVIQQLRLLVLRVKSQSAQYSDLDVEVSPPFGPGRPYAIDVSERRFSRRLWVEQQSAQNLQSGSIEAHLSRELRTTMMMVSRLAQQRA